MEFDQPNEALRFLAAQPADQEVLRRLRVRVDASAVAWVIRHHLPLCIPDVETDALH